MPLDEDKYPTQTGRRRFVKGVVGSAAIAGIAAGGAATVNTATSQTGAGGGTTSYIGIENTGGPAPRGMPIVPIEVTDDGELRGKWPEVGEQDVAGQTITVAEEELGGVTYSSSWFQYCGVQQYAGTQPDADADNLLRVKSGYEWMSDLSTGQPLTVDDFSDYREWGNGIGRSGLGKPANANWRTTQDGRPLPVEILRSPEVPKMINGERGFRDYSQLSQGVRDFLDAATEQNFIAWLDKCTHFCCTPGFKTSTFGGAEDSVYCQCHQSIYDPFSPTELQFVALPRPEE
jgi:Rieske Fe-S protein